VTKAITTSYFANLTNVSNPVSICLYPPSWYTGEQYLPLAPTSRLLDLYKRGKIDEQEFTRTYYADILDHLNPKTVYREILGESPQVTLVCYEKSCDFCHRHLVAAWLNARLKIQVRELPSPSSRPVKSLF